MTTDTNVTVQSSKKKRGFTLTEIAIVLGIIGLILGAVWSAASSVYANASATKISQQMGVYLAGLRSACSNGCSTYPTTLSVAPPTSGGIQISATYPKLDTTGTNVVIEYNKIPATSSGYSFCNGVLSSVSQLGGSASTNGTTVQTVPTPTKSCVSSGGAWQCDPVTGYTVTRTGGSTGTNCTGTTVPAGAACAVALADACAATNVSGAGTLGIMFNLSF